VVWDFIKIQVVNMNNIENRNSIIEKKLSKMFCVGCKHFTLLCTHTHEHLGFKCDIFAHQDVKLENITNCKKFCGKYNIGNK